MTNLKLNAKVTLLAISMTTLLHACGGGGGSDSQEPTVPPTTGGTDPDPAPSTNEFDPTAPADGTLWTLVWNDEFDGDNIDDANWTHEVNCAGGGNNEKQCYTADAENSFVADGVLNIVALPAEAGAQLPYTSARLVSKDKADFKYGRIEISAKLPSGQGSWPAFWMLPTDNVYGGWPNSGEIDILETVNLKVVDANGDEEKTIHGTLHYGEDWPNNQRSGDEVLLPNDASPADDFNVYAIEWQEGEIRWYLNDTLYATQRDSEVEYNSDGEGIGLIHKGWYTSVLNTETNEEEVVYELAPFDQEFHMIINFAVGGDWPENVNNLGIDASAFENGQSLQVDWVRVFECNVDPVTGAGCETGSDAEREATLEEGAATPPSILQDGITSTFTILDDELADGWFFFESSELTTPVLVDDDAERGKVAEFEIPHDQGVVMGFTSRDGGTQLNASTLEANGSISFDLKIVQETISDAASWSFKIESDNRATEVALPLSSSVEGVEPVAGQWQTYTYALQTLANLGLDLSRIDILLMYPTWGLGEGAVYRVDNVTVGPDDVEIVGGTDPITLFADAPHPNWYLWDCCGGTMPEQVQDDEEHGTVAEFRINDNNGTVLGLYGKDTELYNGLGLLENGVLEFELKVVNPTDVDTNWLLKVESNDAAVYAQVDLTSSIENQDIVVGEWQTYTFPLSTLAAAGLDLTNVGIFMVFPAWQTGSGAVYRIDNVKIYDPTDEEE